MFYKSLLGGVATAAVLSMVSAGSAKAVVTNSFDFNFAGSGGTQASYSFSQGDVGVVAEASSFGGLIPAGVSQNSKGLGVDWGRLDGGQVDGFLGRDVLELTFSKPVELASTLFTLVDRNDDTNVTVDGASLYSGNIPLSGVLANFDANVGVTFDFGATDWTDNYRLKGVSVSKYADGTSVPEPLTVIATLIGGSTVLGMRKKLGVVASDSAES